MHHPTAPHRDRPATVPGQRRAVLAATLALAATVALGGPAGCAKAGYLIQAAQGQLELRAHERPLGSVLRDPEIPEQTRALLAELPDIKAFGARHGLTATRSYERYVDVPRPVVVWVVSAAEPLRLRSITWSFPIVGPVPYLGWFSRGAADRFAERLRRRGWDVDVRGAGAYSTLGWFRDPVLSTMLHDGPGAVGALANVVLHESLHATLFVKGQTHFNENIASFVGDRLAGAYLAETRGPRAPEALAYRASLADDAALVRACEAAYARLARLYASPLPTAGKLAEKARILADLEWQTQLGHMPNNATLLEYKAYQSGRAELQALFDACHADWGCFLGALRTVTPRSFSSPNQEDLKPILTPLTKRIAARRRSP